jgi:shikimate kinase / 3-dehydroquinate synthase
VADGIVLVGLPGSGKTTVGRLVAERLGRPFVDTDELVERATGRTPAQLIEEQGEPAFRALERAAVTEACAIDGAIIASGGGAILDPLNRWAFKEHGLRVRLDAPVDVLAARLWATPVSRPLLGDRLNEGLARTAAEREGFYRAVDVRVNNYAALGEVVKEVAAGRPSSGWRPLFEQDQLFIGSGIDAQWLNTLIETSIGGRPATLADARALDTNPSLVEALPTDRLCSMQGGEDAKSMSRLEKVLEWLSSVGAERSDPLVVAGGGTLGDVGGLAAALHHRGMPLVHVPTTWLAQADSSIGGKVAIDLPGAKNAVGAFWPAALIATDIDLLKTLPVDRRRDGLAECLKAGLIGDPVLWELVEERGKAALNGDDPAAVYAITERAVRVKLAIVDRDPTEQGERRVLNLGHTLGHALEAESDYTLAHGAAVALGLRSVAAIASGRGADQALAARIDAVLNDLGFGLHRSFDRGVVVAALAHDKKRAAGRQRWILPMEVGRVIEVDDVTDAELDLAHNAIAA